MTFTDIPLQVAGAVGALSLSGDVLQLDSVIFNEVALEVPDQFGNLGGSQAVESHRFPGGIITQQTFGAFPEDITWSGYFTGTQAFNRVQQVDLIRVTGREVLLRYGPKAWYGRVAMFNPVARHRWLIHYSIQFKPRVDVSQALPGQGPLSPLQQLGKKISDLTGLSNGTPFGLPASLAGPVSAMLAVTVLSLKTANGVVGQISAPHAAGVASAASAVALAASLLKGDRSPLNTYMASAVTSTSAVMSNIIQYPVQAAVTTLQLSNPNFPRLAAQYLHDATRWREIAFFNGLADPTPIGVFTIKIPNPASSAIPTQ